MIWFVNFAARFFMFLILLRMAASWLDPDHSSEYARLLRFLTEPAVAPIRRLVYLPGMRFDFSPLLALVCVELLRGLIQWVLTWDWPGRPLPPRNEFLGWDQERSQIPAGIRLRYEARATGNPDFRTLARVSDRSKSLAQEFIPGRGRRHTLPELSHLSDEDRILVRHLLDLGEKALASQSAAYADFLDPRQREMADRELAVLPNLRRLYYGGYRRAERQRLVLAPDYLLSEAIEPRLAYLDIIPSGPADGITHQDYLGAILGAGVKREKVGDLIVLDRKGQAVLTAEAAAILQTHLTQVGQS